MKKISVFIVMGMMVSCGSQQSQAPKGSINNSLKACIPGDPTAEAKKPAGYNDTEGILTTGRRITPVGSLIHVDKWPLAVKFSPDMKYLYVTHNGKTKFDVIDVATAKSIQTLNIEAYRGVQVSLDGMTIYVAADDTSKVYTYQRQDDGTLVRKQEKFLPGFLADLELTPDGKFLYVMSNTNSKVWKLNADTLDVVDTMEADLYPYDIIVSPDGNKVYVSNTAGNSISALDFATNTKAPLLKTPRAPMGMALSADGKTLYVACSDADKVLKIATDTMTIEKTLETNKSIGVPAGASPNEVALTADNKTLFVSEADLNQVLVIDTTGMSIRGIIPAAFYTTGLALSPDESMLAICSSKGFGAKGSSPHSFTGLVSVVDLSTLDANLAQWTKTAKANYNRVSSFFPKDCKYPLPVAATPGNGPIKHVVLIVRENKTYDCDLGDFKRGNGDPKLVVFGKKYTPNLHELARQFVNLDNYYADSEESKQGHNWTTQADCNDTFEKMDQSQFLLIGIDPALIKNNYTIFDNCLDNKITFRNYGEWEGFGRDLFGKFAPYIDRKFPFFDLGISDVVKANEFIREMKLGIFPQFVYIALPNDHTMGTKVGFPTPDWYVANNDRATGMIMDAISHSKYWASTAIFLIEDDPQGYGGDHVYPNRSIGLVISPWVKREFTSSVHYSIPSVYRTIEMLLGLPPMNLNDAMAPPMYDIWVSTPDNTPYTAIDPGIPMAKNTARSFGAAMSAKMDFSKPDHAPGLGYVLWHYMKGADVNPPAYAKWNDK